MNAPKSSNFNQAFMSGLMGFNAGSALKKGIGSLTSLPAATRGFAVGGTASAPANYRHGFQPEYNYGFLPPMPGESLEERKARAARQQQQREEDAAAATAAAGGGEVGGAAASALTLGPTVLGLANDAYGFLNPTGKTAFQAGKEYLLGPDAPAVDGNSLNLFDNPNNIGRQNIGQQNIGQQNPVEWVNPDAPAKAAVNNPVLGGNAVPLQGGSFGSPGMGALGDAFSLPAGNLGLNAGIDGLSGSALPGGVGETVGIGPSGYLSPDALAGQSHLFEASPDALAGLGGAGVNSAASIAALGYGGVPITAAHPALSGAGLLGSGQLAATTAPAGLSGSGLLGSGQLAAGAGAAGAALGGGAGIAGLGFGGGASGAIGAQAAAAATPALGGLAALGPAAMIALPFIARALLDKPTDPTINARLTQQFEGTAQAKGIEGMEKAIYANPNLYDLGRIATSGRTGGHGRVQLAPPGTKPTNGGTAVIPWSSELSDLFNKNIDSLQAASHAGQLNTSGVGMDGPDKYHPIYKPDPNIYEMVAGEYDIMERRLVGGPAYEDSLTYAEGGTVNAQPEAPEQGAGPNPLVMGAIEAIMGQHPEPEKAIDAFIQVYGKAAFAELRKGVIAEGSKGEREQAGLGAVPAQGGGIAGPGTDTSDSIPGQITQGGQPVENIKVADGEYILPKKMVDGMGGEAALDEAREQFI